MKQFEAEILANEELSESWRKLSLSWDASAGHPLPGQFLTLRVSPRHDPLLRRPFAFADFSPSRRSVAILYQVRGGATSILASLSQRSRIDVLGPLGRPFPLPARGESPILAAGGIGLGPILFLAGELARAAAEGPGEAKEGSDAGGEGTGGEGSAKPGARAAPTHGIVSAEPGPPIPEGGSPVDARGARLESRHAEQIESPRPAPFPSGPPALVVGFRSSGLAPALDLPPGAVVCTDDGSRGFEGNPALWIERFAPRRRPSHLYGCGPSPMLAALARLAASRSWPAHLAAEQWMACGVGACMGCALPRADRGGFLRACTDGPVFDSGQIAWDVAAGGSSAGGGPADGNLARGGGPEGAGP